MAADFKSHVLLRDEKGLFGIPFKRLLLAGVSGGMFYTCANLLLPGWSIALALLTALLTLFLTGLRGGIPLWQRQIFRLRGTLLLLAARYPRSLIGQLSAALELPTDLVRLEGERVFAASAQSVDPDLREWITFAHAHETDGLVFVDAPLKEVPDERR
jgi:hypothetical protein